MPIDPVGAINPVQTYRIENPRPVEETAPPPEETTAEQQNTEPENREANAPLNTLGIGQYINTLA